MRRVLELVLLAAQSKLTIVASIYSFCPHIEREVCYKEGEGWEEVEERKKREEHLLILTVLHQSVLQSPQIHSLVHLLFPGFLNFAF